MDEQIEKVIALAGNEHRYQYFTLIVIMFLWVNCNFISCVLPCLEREPIVNYIDSKGEKHDNEILTSDVCAELKGRNYTVVESFKYSWITEYNIECHNFEIANIGSFAFIGNALGGFVFSLINKFLSHKKILILSSIGFCIAAFLCTLIRSFDYFYVLLVCEIFIGLFGNCLCYSSLVVAQEIVANKKRSLFSSIINVGYSLCGIIYALLFYFLNDWRIVFYVLIGASIFTLILIWVFIYDSPRGYINNNNYDKVIEILEGIASFNGKLDEFRETIKQDDYQEIVSVIKGEKAPTVIKGVERPINSSVNSNQSLKEDEYEFSKDISETRITNLTSSLIDQNNAAPKTEYKIHKINVWSLFKYPSVRYKFLLLNFLWVGTRGSFNGITISSKSFPGNFYVNMIVLYILESVSYIVSGILIDIKKLGRRGTLWIEYSILAVIVILLMSLDLGTVGSLILNYISRFCSAGIEVIYYTYSIELYPTPVRSVAFGINATFGNAGSILAPQLLEFLLKWQFLGVIAAITVVNALVLICLQETVGKPMVETIKELEDDNLINDDIKKVQNENLYEDKDNGDDDIKNDENLEVKDDNNLKNNEEKNLEGNKIDDNEKKQKDINGENTDEALMDKDSN